MEHSMLEAALEIGQTPCYVFDLDVLRERVQLIQNLLGEKTTVCYAMKANPFLVKPMDAYMGRFEVCSPGEYEICYRAGIHPSKIVVSGVNKTEKSMKRIMELSHGEGVFTIESEEHYRILSGICKENQIHIKVLLRLSSGNQFGMDTKYLEQVLLQVKEDAYMEIEGLHFYSGTQKKVKKVAKELEYLETYAKYIRETYGIVLKELEYGPGLSVTYFESDSPLEPSQQLQELKELLDGITEYTHIIIEMGRFVASACGYYFTKVMDVKQNNDVYYAIVDGGIHQLNYYGQLMGMKIPHMKVLQKQVAVQEQMPWTICGSLCTVNDVILKGALLPMLAKGDCIVFENCGAYSVTEGMALFLSRELPQILFFTKENGFEIEREQIETNIINSKEITLWKN